MKKFFSATALILFLSGCTTPAMVKKADNVTADKAVSFEVTKKRSKVYIIAGVLRDALWKIKHEAPSDIYVNGKKIGSKNGRDVMVFELEPGKYDFSWQSRGEDIGKKAISHILKKTLLGGEITVLQQDYSQGGAGHGAAGGILGVLVGAYVGAPPGLWFVEGDTDAAKSAINGGNIVVPQFCKPTLCLK